MLCSSYGAARQNRKGGIALNVESLLYIYLFVCAGMIVFNIVTAILLRKNDRKIAKVS